MERKILMTMLLCLLISGCTQNNNPRSSPTFGGFTKYPGALPSPQNLQDNSAISASTMVPSR